MPYSVPSDGGRPRPPGDPAQLRLRRAPDGSARDAPAPGGAARVLARGPLPEARRARLLARRRARGAPRLAGGRARARTRIAAAARRAVAALHRARGSLAVRDGLRARRRAGLRQRVARPPARAAGRPSRAARLRPDPALRAQSEPRERRRAG